MWMFLVGIQSPETRIGFHLKLAHTAGENHNYDARLYMYNGLVIIAE